MPVREAAVGHDHGGVADDLEKRLVAHRDDGCAARHRLEDRQAEALVERRLHEAGGAAVELGELVGLDVAAHRRPTLAQLARDGGVLLGADDDERHAHRLRRLERGELVLARLDGADREHVVACAPPSPGRKTGSTPFGVTTTAAGARP